jgi:nucleoid-associated protein YgaU
MPPHPIKGAIMGLLSFIKEAGEKLFGKGEAKAAQEAVAADPSPPNLEALNAAAAKAISDYIASQNISADGLTVLFDGASGAVTVRGIAPDQATREKIVLCCGNVHGVDSVNDELSVLEQVEEVAAAQYYTVVSGDNLSKISKQFYGNPNKYMVIFEANKPMLSHPDKIYPGQMLRIPPAE